MPIFHTYIKCRNIDAFEGFQRKVVFVLIVSNENKHIGSPSRYSETEVFKANFKGRSNPEVVGLKLLEIWDRGYPPASSTLFMVSLFLFPE